MRRVLVSGVVLVGAIACSGGSQSAVDGGNLNTGSTSSGSTGTGKPTEVKDEGFSHACATDNDCVVVFFGNTCGICNSSNGAIAASAQAAHQQAFNTARANCPEDRAVGKCAQSFGISRCNEAKSCVFVACDLRPADEHHCAAADGGG
jgi:hypothetical protein